MTQRGKLISRSRKEPDCHDPERKNGFWVKKRTGLPLPGEEKMISRSRKQANQHDPEEKSTLISI